MMEAAANPAAWLEALMMILAIGLPGLPPGERDAQLWQAIPQDAVVACEWSAQGEPQPGAAGLAGALGDPEIARSTAALHQWMQLKLKLADAPGQESSRQASWSEAHTLRMVQVLLSHPGCAFVSFADSAPGIPLTERVAAGIILSTKDSERLRAELTPLLPEWTLVDALNPQERQPHTTGLIRLYRIGDRWCWLVGKHTVDGVVSRLASGGGLADDPQFRSLTRLSVERPGMTFWLRPGTQLSDIVQRLSLPGDLNRAIEQVTTLLPNSALMATLGTEQGRVLGRATWTSPGLVQLSALSVPIAPQTFKLIPPDAQLVSSASLNLSSAFQTARPWAEAALTTRGINLDHIGERIEQQLGMSLDRDVWPAFGQTWTVYTAPSTGGAFGLGPVFSVDVRKPQAAYAAFAQAMILLQQAANAHPRAARFSSEVFEDRQLYTLTSATDRAQCAVTFCMTDKQLLLTLQPQTMRAHLRFLARNGRTFADRLGQDVSMPPRPVAWLFCDAPAFTSLLWPLVPHVANAPLEDLRELGLGIDGSVIPSTAAMLEHSAPMTASAALVPEGLSLEVHNPLSIAAPILGALALRSLQDAGPVSHRLSPDSTTPPDDNLSLGAPADADSLNLGEPNESRPVDALSALHPTLDTAPQPAVPGAPPVPRRGGAFAASVIRSFTPDDVELLIPSDVFRRLEEGPSPEEAAQRQARRDARDRRRAARRGIAPSKSESTTSPPLGDAPSQP